MLGVICLSVALCFLVQAQQILIPITAACFLNVLLSPLIDAGRKYRIPNAVSAAAIMFLFGVLIFSLATSLAEPAKRWIHELPVNLSQIRYELASFKQPLSNIRKVGSQLAAITDDTQKKEAVVVEVDDSSWIKDLLVEDIPAISMSTLIVTVLTFFLLSSRNSFLRQSTQLTRRWGQKRQILKISHSIQREIARYLRAITFINIGLGGVVALALYLLDMSNPIFWGVVAALLNFAPYIGPLLTIILLAVASLSVYSTLGHAVLVPMTFAIITALEGHLITPTIIGRQLSLNATSVFLSVIIWTWMWGIPGALLASPILVTLKILYDNVEFVDASAKTSATIHKESATV